MFLRSSPETPGTIRTIAMTFSITFFGAAEQVTGSLYVTRADSHTVLLECGLVQGSGEEEARNREPFPSARPA